MNINSLKIFGLLIIILTTVISACGESDTVAVMCADVSREPRRLESTEPFVHLYAPKVNVTAGEQFSLNLAALNPTGTAGNMDVTLILTVPSGISIDGSDFGTSVQGFTHYTFTLAKGDSREIRIHMSAGAPPEDQLVENRKFRGEIFWEVENSNQSSSDCYEVDLTVSHEPVELIFDLSDLPDDADVRVASPGMCSQNNRCSLPYLKTQDLDINLNEEYEFLRYEYAGNKPEDVNSRSTTIRLTENTTITPFVEKVLVDTTLTLWAAPGGAGSVSAGGRDCSDGCIYPADIRLKINANPNSGWDFVRWEYSGSEPDSLTSAETDVILTEDTTISAIFERASLTLILRASGGGTVSPSSCRNDGCERDYGDRVNVTANPDTGWFFVRWEYSGSEPNNPTRAETAIALTEDTTATAIFERVTVTLTLRADEGGTVSPSSCRNNGCERNYGEQVDITANPDTGWDFVRWEYSGSEPKNLDSDETDITLTEDTTATAIFERVTVTLTLRAGEGGTVSPSSCRSSGCERNYGEQVGITANPDTGWDFVRWEYSGSAPNSINSAATRVTPTEDTTVTAIFERESVTLTLIAGAGGTVTPVSCRNNGCEQDYGEVVGITANPNSGWTFVRWEYSGSAPNSTNSAQTLVAPTEDTTVTAIFERESVTLTLIAGAGGTVSPSSCLNDGCEQDYGEIVGITANPNSGWTFVRWEYSGSAPNSTNSAQTFVIPIEDTTITAIFRDDTSRQVQLLVIVEDGGSLASFTFGEKCDRTETCGGRFNYGESVPIIGLPYHGWSFDRWEIVNGGIPGNFSPSDMNHRITLNGNFVLRLWFKRDG